MSERHLLRKPRKAKVLPTANSAREAWWYEEKNGITVVVQGMGPASQIVITANQLRGYFKRLDTI